MSLRRIATRAGSASLATATVHATGMRPNYIWVRPPKGRQRATLPLGPFALALRMVARVAPRGNAPRRIPSAGRMSVFEPGEETEWTQRRLRYRRGGAKRYTWRADGTSS